MKIFNIELSGRSFIMAASAAITAAGLLIYAIFYIPLIRQFKAAHAECESWEGRLADAHGVISAAGRIYTDRAFVTEKDVSAAIDELTRYAKAIGVNFRFIRPGEIRQDKDSRYKVLPIEMEIEAGDTQFFDFLGSLDELKKGLFKVYSFGILPDGDDRSRLHADLVVDLYLSARDHDAG